MDLRNTLRYVPEFRPFCAERRCGPEPPSRRARRPGGQAIQLKAAPRRLWSGRLFGVTKAAANARIWGKSMQPMYTGLRSPGSFIPAMEAVEAVQCTLTLLSSTG